MRINNVDLTTLPTEIQAQISSNFVNSFEAGIGTIELIKVFIQSGARHKHYNRVVKLARKNKILATGENAGELLEQFNPRESSEAFEQRVKLTKLITPALYNSLKKPFNKANRNNNIKVVVDLEGKTETIDKMRKSFFSSSKHSDSQGLDYWLKNEYLDKSFIDPNSWLVVEWLPGESETDAFRPYPFIVPSSDALNYNIENNNVKWLFVSRSINYLKYNTTNNKLEQKEGLKYIYYTKGATVTATQCCKVYLTKNGLIDQYDVWEKDDKTNFIIESYDTKLDFVPATQLGYVRDQETDGETFTTPLQPAMPYFDKSVKTGSEFDLTTFLHLFPKLTELRSKCKAFNNDHQPCNNGKYGHTNETCTNCKGTGYNMVMSAQDVRIIEMPENLMELPDLSKLTHYDHPPMDLVRFLKELLDSYFLDSHRAVFSTTTMVEKSIISNKTATEVDSDYQQVYDTLEPFTEKVSALFKFVVMVMFHLTGAPENVIERAKLVHKYPDDLKLKSVNQLLTDLAKANEAHAPSFLKSRITSDIADITYSDSTEERYKFKIQDLFYPFSGKSPEEIIQLMASTYVAEDDKILYANYEVIFREIEMEHRDFYLLQYNRQWEIIKGKIEEYKSRIRESGPQAPTTDINLGLLELNLKENENEEDVIVSEDPILE